MPAITEWAAIAFLSTSAGQPNVAWSTLLEKLQEAIPISWFWVIFPLGVGAFLFILDVGDKLSGILGWLGIESPLRRGAQPESDWQRYRRILLNRVKRDVDGQVEASFYERVKLDLDMEDQEQQVGKHKIELVPEDTLEVFSTSTESLLNRVFQVFKSQKISPLPLASTQKIVDVFDRGDIQGQLLILGEPGAGKTTELLYLAQDLLERALKNENSPIPVFLELTTWDEGKSIDEWIAEKLSKPKSGGGYGINKLIVDQWIQDDDIIPLLDGLDEIVSLKRQRKCIKAINNFLAKRSPHGLVVCCRRKEYESAQVQINSLKGAVSLKPLREDQIQYFFQCLNRLSIWERIKDNSTMLDLARTPLFLSMLVETYQGKSITSDVELINAFIAKKIETANTGFYPSNKEPDGQQICRYLAWLAQQLENTGEKYFLIEGLQPSLLRQNQEELELYKVIVSLIEFLIFGLIIGLSLWLRGWINFKMSGGGNNSLLFGLSFGLSFVVNGFVVILLGLSKKWWDGLSAPIQLSEKWNFSFSNGLSSGLMIGLKAGIFFGAFFGVLFGVLSRPSIRLGFGLASGVIYGFIVGLLKYLFVGLRVDSIDERDVPNQGVKQSLRNSLINGLIVGLMFGMFFGLIGGLTAGFVAGIIFGMLLGMASGLKAFLRHIALRIVLTKNSHIPWKYAHFLNHAVELRFLQRVGGRYRFVHNLLRESFATMPLNK